VLAYTKTHQDNLNVLRAYVERAHGLKDVEVQPPGEEPDIDVFRRQAEEYGKAKEAAQAAKAAAKGQS
jgi:hypothetical protein